MPESLDSKCRCDSCGWWQAHSRVGLFGDCTLFECRKKEQVHRESKVIVTRTQSGEATIVTSSDFGCVQWKSRTSQSSAT